MGKSELELKAEISQLLERRYRELFGENLTDKEILEIHSNLTQIAQVIERFVTNTSDREILSLTRKL